MQLQILDLYACFTTRDRSEDWNLAAFLYENTLTASRSQRVPTTKSSFDFHDNGREFECTSFRGDRQASGLSIFNERNSRPLRHYDDLSSAP